MVDNQTRNSNPTRNGLLIQSLQISAANGGRKARGGIASDFAICWAGPGPPIDILSCGVQSQPNRGPHGPRSPLNRQTITHRVTSSCPALARFGGRSPLFCPAKNGYNPGFPILRLTCPGETCQNKRRTRGPRNDSV